ncbi:MAG: hypothetical protein ABI024_17545 [Vicinamibacterales bacterium]
MLVVDRPDRGIRLIDFEKFPRRFHLTAHLGQPTLNGEHPRGCPGDQHYGEQNLHALIPDP